MEKLNNFIRRNNLILDIKDKYKCQICSGVLVDTMESRCLCKFCKKCVIQYLNGEDKQCPGCQKKNIENIINYERDITNSFSVEAKIKTLKSKCVYNDCDEQIEMLHMLEHIQQCVHSDNLCSGGIDAVKEIAVLRNINNELNEKMMKLSGVTKEKMNKIEKENVEIRTENVEMKNNYLELRNKLDGFIKNNKEATEKSQKELVELKKENVEIRKENVEMKKKYENTTKDNKEMRKKMEENEERLKSMRRMIESLNEEMKLLQEKNETLPKKFEENKNAPIRGDGINRYDYTFTNMSRIKRDEDHFSPFQLSNYEFRFRIVYWSDGEIEIYLDLLASSNESSKKWPIKKKFVLELIKNEKTVAKSEFDRDSSEDKDQFEKVKEDCTTMGDSEIYTYESDAIFGDQMKVRLSLI